MGASKKEGVPSPPLCDDKKEQPRRNERRTMCGSEPKWKSTVMLSEPYKDGRVLPLLMRLVCCISESSPPSSAEGWWSLRENDNVVNARLKRIDSAFHNWLTVYPYEILPGSFMTPSKIMTQNKTIIIVGLYFFTIFMTLVNCFFQRVCGTMVCLFLVCLHHSREIVEFHSDLTFPSPCFTFTAGIPPQQQAKHNVLPSH